MTGLLGAIIGATGFGVANIVIKKSLFTFITTNTQKIKNAHHYLDPLKITFSTQSLDLTEIQSSSVEEVAKFKAQQAFAMLKKPVVVSDHGWAFHGLNGFPGAYMKEVNTWFTAQDFLTLLHEKKDRTVTRTEAICYFDGAELKSFTQDIIGRVVDSPRSKGFPTYQLVSFVKSGKTIGELLEEGKDPHGDQLTVWREFGEWLMEYKNNVELI